MEQLKLKELEIINCENIPNKFFSFSTFSKVTIHCEIFESGKYLNGKIENDKLCFKMKNGKEQIFNFNNNQNFLNSLQS